MLLRTGSHGATVKIIGSHTVCSNHGNLVHCVHGKCIICGLSLTECNSLGLNQMNHLICTNYEFEVQYCDKEGKLG